MSYNGNVLSYPVSRPLRASNWTLRQGGSLGTLTDIAGGGLRLAATAGTNDNWIVADLALASGAYTLTGAFQYTSKSASNDFYAGLSLYEVSSTKLLTFCMETSGGGLRVVAQYRTGLTGSPTTIRDTSTTIPSQSKIYWLRIVDDKTDRRFYYSVDGKNFTFFFSHASSTGPTTAFDRAGFAINPYNQPVDMSLYSWKLDSVFSPSDISGSYLWLRSDMGITTTTGDRVTQWTDHSANGSNTFSNFVSNQPLYLYSGGLNNLPVLRSTASNSEYLVRSGGIGFNPNSNWTVAMVLKLNATTVGKHLFQLGDSPSAGAAIRIGASSARTFLGYDGGGGSFSNNDGTATTNAEKWIWRRNTSDATFLTLRVNGSNQSLDNANVTFGSGGGDNYLFIDQVGGSASISMDLYEVVVWSGAISDSDRTSLESYFLQRYGI